MSSSEQRSSITITGTGEFQRKHSHVMATVEIKNNLIRSVGFTLGSGENEEGCKAVSKMLIDRQVSEVLSVTSSELMDAIPHTFEAGECEVLLEAFHRAVESCLDSE